MLYQAAPQDGTKNEANSLGGHLETERQNIQSQKPELSGDFSVPDVVKNLTREEIKAAIEIARQKRAGSAEVEQVNERTIDEMQVNLNVLSDTPVEKVVDGSEVPNNDRVNRMNTMLQDLHSGTLKKSPFSIAKNDLGLVNEHKE